MGFSDTLIIYTSTDQVYNGGVNGDLRPYKEIGLAPSPRNQYGVSKLAFEKLLAKEWGHFVVLRCSNIVGEPSPLDGTGKFLQWILSTALHQSADKSDAVSAVGSTRPTVSLFDDEFRSFVDVADVVRVIRAVMHLNRAELRIVLNCGGPERMSRYALGQRIARHLRQQRGAETIDVTGVHASTIEMGYDSPPDLTMVWHSTPHMAAGTLVPVPNPTFPNLG
eukprot:m.423617 g.423617  ORF g.423617 m.423617 type:complete len:222 (+) comp21334_c0_seq19:1150-1815(+)